MSPCLYEPRFPHLAAGRSTQQLKANAKNNTTCVHQGVSRIDEPFQLMFDQSKERFKKPIPPIPDPIKLATGFRGATQQRKASDEVNGKTYSGRNCQSVIPRREKKKIFI